MLFGFCGVIRTAILEMKANMVKQAPPGTWIIFSYFFNIDAKASSQHIDDRIPHLISLGVRPFVVSSICAERSTDVTNYRVPSVAPSGMRFELRYLKRRNKFFRFAAIPLLILILPLYLLEKAIINLESEWSWFPLAFLRGLLLCRKIQPALIYSTGGPPSAHLAAGLLARWTKMPWIAELQDPIVFEVWKRSKTALKINSKLERFIVEKASAVVFLTEGSRERTVRRTGANASKTHVIYPGACPAHMPRAIYSKGDFCRLAHFGSFGGSRNPDKFLQGLQIVLDQNPNLIEKVRFGLYGTLDRFSVSLVDKFKYRRIVTCFGKVSRLEALGEMQRTDALVLIENPDQSYETIPAKVYEYLQMNRPILGLLYHNPHLKKMLIERGHFIAQGDSPAGIGEQVALILELWQSGELDSRNFAGSPYTVRDAAERLLEISRGTFRVL
jgi:glycosyltransferase involved in cell wall biosynthesis